MRLGKPKHQKRNWDIFNEIPVYWFKVVEFLQTNWALVDEQPDGSAHVWFIGDTSGVFDEMYFESLEQAVEGLVANGFDLYSENQKAQTFLKPPPRPFRTESHPNGPIYSSGRFWKTFA